jgi:hypothetical protein
VVGREEAEKDIVLKDSNSLIMPLWPLSAAYNSGVSPKSSIDLMLALALSSSLIMPLWPLLAAYNSGV